MKSNVLTTVGVLLVLACLILLGGWKLAIGVLGVLLVVAGYQANASASQDVERKQVTHE